MQVPFNSPAILTIKEVSILLSISQSTLRNWEVVYSLPVERNKSGQRQYTTNIVSCLKIIKNSSTKGLQQHDIKNQVQQELQGYNTAAPSIEILQENEQNTEHKFNLIIKPYELKITKLEDENKELIRENATLAERVKGKEEIIQFQHSKIAEIEAKLNKKWYDFLFKPLFSQDNNK